ncbi:MAG TPA: OmpA family protein [Vicinamibacterales bacterium]|nr:OmpA family protein [Vicinamibacterales bacterium]
MRKPVFVVGLLALTLGVAPACATKKFVRTEVGQVNDKVGTLGKSLEDTQERVRQNEGRITEVDSKAAAAQNSANQAGQAAQAASQQATQVGQQASARSDSIEAANRKLIYEVVLSEDQGKFRSGRTDLPAEATAALDQMVASLQNQKSAIWVEIEGHTDNVGDKKFNEQLGLNRAEAVKRYLYEKHQIPLHKMNVISYGEEKPVAPNRTRAGRAQNRRVVIKVLA